MSFIGREKELSALNDLYNKNEFQLFVLYGRRRVGKTTLLNEFCKDKDAIFYSAEQSNNKLNLAKFSEIVFDYYGEESLSPFASWEKALLYINERQKDKRLVIIFDEFPYLVKGNKSVLSEFQHLIDHKLKNGKLFVVLCGSYMGFMEKEVLGAKSPLFGRRTGQLQMKSFDYKDSVNFLSGYSKQEQLMLYGAFGGTPLYLSLIDSKRNFEQNIKDNFLKVTAYLYEEPLLLLRQEVQEPGVYSAIIEAIAGGATKANEISTKIGEDSAKCIKYINTLCSLGIIYKEVPFGEKESSRKTIYGISDLMFRFWYKYIFPNRTLIETGAADIVYKKRIDETYNEYMGIVFENICKQYLLIENVNGNLPVLFTKIGRWWGNDPKSKSQVEIDLVANDEKSYIFCECKWRNEKIDINVLEELKKKSNLFNNKCDIKYYVLFSKSGFTDAVKKACETEKNIILVDLEKLL